MHYYTIYKETAGLIRLAKLINSSLDQVSSDDFKILKLHAVYENQNFARSINFALKQFRMIFFVFNASLKIIFWVRRSIYLII